MTADSVTIPISFRLRASLAQRMKMSSIGLICVAGSAAAVAWADTPTEHLVGVVSLCFFSCCLLGYLIMLACGFPRIDIDEEGIYVQTSLADGVRLAWEEIASIERSAVIGQDMILITPLPTVGWEARLSLIGRALVRINRSVGIHGILVARSTLGDRYELAWTALRNGFARVTESRRPDRG